MVKSKRQAIYDWLVKNKEAVGAVYKDKPIEVSQLDYDRIRVRLKLGYPYAEYEMERISDNKVKLLIRIKENPQANKDTDYSEKDAQNA